MKLAIKTIDRVIVSNIDPSITGVLALKLYRHLLKAHGKLGPKKEYVKERMELHDAIMTLSSLY